MARAIEQAAAIPVYDGRVCLVTSRTGRRWVIPKGKIDPGHTAAEAARIEAWEEAGVRGTLGRVAIGSYEYEKYGRVHRVSVFVMRVSDAKDDWPECRVRQREWLALDDAIERIEEPDLRDLLRAVFAAAEQQAGV
jgi:8-oxo-dGTP pyrophosphatase MutT (NUDIX family)